MTKYDPFGQPISIEGIKLSQRRAVGWRAEAGLARSGDRHVPGGAAVRRADVGARRLRGARPRCDALDALARRPPHRPHVRPPALIASLREVIQQGAPFVMFGDGEVTRCNPISEADLATYLIDSITDKSRENQIINLGGPDEPLTMKKQGEMLFDAVDKEPNFFYAPLWLFDVIIDSLQWVADTFNSEQFENAAETGRIGKYYAVEDMLTTDPDEKFGTMTLMEHYEKIAKDGQEYDPYTTMFAKAPASTE